MHEPATLLQVQIRRHRGRHDFTLCQSIHRAKHPTIPIGSRAPRFLGLTPFLVNHHATINLLIQDLGALLDFGRVFGDVVSDVHTEDHLGVGVLDCQFVEEHRGVSKVQKRRPSRVGHEYVIDFS